MMGKKLAIYLSNLGAGGIQKVMINLSHELIDRGYQVDFVTTRGVGEFANLVPEKARVVNFNLSSTYKSLLPLMKYLAAQKPNALLSTHPLLNVSALWARKLSRSKTRIVVSEHNDPTSAYMYRKTQKRLVRNPFLEKSFYPWADAIVAVSQGVAKGMSQHTGIALDRIDVIYNPVVNDQLRQLASEKVAWPFESSGPRKTRVLAVGQLRPQKDFSTLLRAFKEFQSKSSAELLILGDGREKEKLQSLIEDLELGESALLFGHTQNPYAYMSIADVFVSSSLWEGLPTVHIEALATGLQVVSTDCPSGPSEILQDGEFGWLVPTQDPQALVAAIQEAINAPKSAEILKKRAEHFSFNEAAEKYIDVLQI